MTLKSWLREKLNPAQSIIALGQPEAPSTEPEFSYVYYYENIEIVNRAINMIIDDAAEVNYAVGTTKIVPLPRVSSVRRVTINNLLNVQPNPYQDISSFRRNLLIDFLIDGNIFVFFDGLHLYHLPASKVNIIADSETFVKHYEFDGGREKFKPESIIHIKDNSTQSIYRGISRLKPALRTLKLMKRMRDFQDNFFTNGAVPGLIIKSPDILSPRIKQRMKQDWSQSYNPTSGGRRPMILDGGMSIEPLTKTNFQELDFANSVDNNEKVILKALGVPPILIDSGNNANLRPNHRLYYLETILPIVQKICSAYQSFFGFEVYEDIIGIPAMQPELRDEAAYYSTLVNGGILTPDEARVAMGKEPLPDGAGAEIRVPANVAGSAADPSQGGRPSGGGKNE